MAGQKFPDPPSASRKKAAEKHSNTTFNSTFHTASESFNENDNLLNWIDGLKTRVDSTLTKQKSELVQLRKKTHEEDLRRKYRTQIFSASFDKLGQLLDTENGETSIDECNDQVSRVSQDSPYPESAKYDAFDMANGEQSDDDIIEIISEPERQAESDEPEDFAEEIEAEFDEPEEFDQSEDLEAEELEAEALEAEEYDDEFDEELEVLSQSEGPESDSQLFTQQLASRAVAYSVQNGRPRLSDVPRPQESESEDVDSEQIGSEDSGIDEPGSEEASSEEIGSEDSAAEDSAAEKEDTSENNHGVESPQPALEPELVAESESEADAEANLKQNLDPEILGAFAQGDESFDDQNAVDDGNEEYPPEEQFSEAASEAAQSTGYDGVHLSEQSLAETAASALNAISSDSAYLTDLVESIIYDQSQNEMEVLTEDMKTELQDFVEQESELFLEQGNARADVDAVDLESFAEAESQLINEEESKDVDAAEDAEELVDDADVEASSTDSELAVNGGPEHVSSVPVANLQFPVFKSIPEEDPRAVLKQLKETERKFHLHLEAVAQLKEELGTDAESERDQFQDVEHESEEPETDRPSLNLWGWVKQLNPFAHSQKSNDTQNSEHPQNPDPLEFQENTVTHEEAAVLSKPEIPVLDDIDMSDSESESDQNVVVDEPADVDEILVVYDNFTEFENERLIEPTSIETPCVTPSVETPNFALEFVTQVSNDALVPTEIVEPEEIQEVIVETFEEAEDFVQPSLIQELESSRNTPILESVYKASEPPGEEVTAAEIEQNGVSEDSKSFKRKHESEGESPKKRFRSAVSKLNPFHWRFANSDDAEHDEVAAESAVSESQEDNAVGNQAGSDAGRVVLNEQDSDIPMEESLQDAAGEDSETVSSEFESSTLLPLPKASQLRSIVEILDQAPVESQQLDASESSQGEDGDINGSGDSSEEPIDGSVRAMNVQPAEDPLKDNESHEKSFEQFVGDSVREVVNQPAEAMSVSEETGSPEEPAEESLDATNITFEKFVEDSVRQMVDQPAEISRDVSDNEEVATKTFEEFVEDTVREAVEQPGELYPEETFENAHEPEASEPAVIPEMSFQEFVQDSVREVVDQPADVLDVSSAEVPETSFEKFVGDSVREMVDQPAERASEDVSETENNHEEPAGFPEDSVEVPEKSFKELVEKTIRDAVDQPAEQLADETSISAEQPEPAKDSVESSEKSFEKSVGEMVEQPEQMFSGATPEPTEDLEPSTKVTESAIEAAGSGDDSMGGARDQEEPTEAFPADPQNTDPGNSPRNRVLQPFYDVFRFVGSKFSSNDSREVSDTEVEAEAAEVPDIHIIPPSTEDLTNVSDVRPATYVEENDYSEVESQTPQVEESEDGTLGQPSEENDTVHHIMSLMKDKAVKIIKDKHTDDKHTDDEHTIESQDEPKSNAVDSDLGEQSAAQGVEEEPEAGEAESAETTEPTLEMAETEREQDEETDKGLELGGPTEAGLDESKPSVEDKEPEAAQSPKANPAKVAKSRPTRKAAKVKKPITGKPKRKAATPPARVLRNHKTARESQEEPREASPEPSKPEAMPSSPMKKQRGPTAAPASERATRLPSDAHLHTDSQDHPALRTRSRSPIKRSLQELAHDIDEEPIRKRRVSRRASQSKHGEEQETRGRRRNR